MGARANIWMITPSTFTNTRLFQFRGSANIPP